MTDCPHCGRTLPTPADRLRAAREAAGLTQSEAARRVRVPRQHWHRWESGEQSPRPARLAQMLDALTRRE